CNNSKFHFEFFVWVSWWLASHRNAYREIYRLSRMFLRSVACHIVEPDRQGRAKVYWRHLCAVAFYNLCLDLLFYNVVCKSPEAFCNALTIGLYFKRRACHSTSR